jgi:methylenetetrahydrofolate dehydrogenase (NADP+)/methenyltetrahydrofolate cyclohydrolase
MARILDGKATAAEVRAEVAEGVKALEARGHPVRLDVILVGEDPASVTYVRNKQTDCAEVGIESQAHRFPEVAAQEELATVVERLNEDPEVSGFFIQLPLPEHLDPRSLLSCIDPGKDVDGLNPESAGRLSLGLTSLLPCTPHGIVQLLRRDGIPLEGRETVILGRSNLVGCADGTAPLAGERHRHRLPLAHEEPGRGSRSRRRSRRRPGPAGDGRRRVREGGSCSSGRGDPPERRRRVGG